MNKAILISFSGVDGSGKSTQAKLLQERLERMGKKVKLTSAFSYFLLKPLIAAGGAKHKDQLSGVVRRNTNVFAKLWFIAALIDFWVIYWLKIKPLRASYDFVIEDRYFYDLAVSMAYYGYMPESLLKSYSSLLPRADKSILINIDPDIAFERAKEFDISYFRKECELYREVEGFDVLNGEEKSSVLQEHIFKMVE